MRRLLLVFAMLALPVAAQEKTIPSTAQTPESPKVQKLFVLKYAEPRAVQNVLRAFPATVESNSEMHALAVTATEPTMKAIEEAIGRLDIPAAAPKNVELVCYLVIGSEGASDAAPMPKELDSVVAQLKNAFAFKSYRLMDTLAIRTRTGQRVDTTSAGGTMPSNTQGAPNGISTQFHINSASLSPDGTAVHLDGLRTSSQMPIYQGGNTAWRDLGILTDVDIKDGQKVVVGRIGVTHDQALFLVLMAKVVS